MKKMSSKHIMAREDFEFYNNTKRLYPLEKSHADRTKRLNKVLEEMLYGKKD